MPQYQRQKQGQARVRILPKDATRAYLLMMQKCSSGLQVLPGDVYVVSEKAVGILRENGIAFEILEQKGSAE